MIVNTDMCQLLDRYYVRYDVLPQCETFCIRNGTIKCQRTVVKLDELSILYIYLQYFILLVSKRQVPCLWSFDLTH